MEGKYIRQFYVHRLWDRLDVSWENIYPDVNILVGINGCGKTTLLNLIFDYYNGIRVKKTLAQALEGNPVSSPVTYIRSFDIPANGKKKSESMLLQALKNIINQNGEGTSFFDYRMKQMNYPAKSEEIRTRIAHFFRLIDKMFADTGKHVGIDPATNTLVFYLSSRTCDKEEKGTGETFVTLEQLSSGEKQLLLILTTVFLQENQPHILLLDEPEISLHIEWQDKLVATLRELNPNCQLILTTHSPNIFANGWEDKIVFMEDLETPDPHEC